MKLLRPKRADLPLPTPLEDERHEGFLDEVRRVEGGFEFRGWFRVRSGDSEARIRLLLEGHEAVQASASQFRWDLYQAGFGNPCLGFSVVLPEEHLFGATTTIDVCSVDSDNCLASVQLSDSLPKLNARFAWSVESLAPIVRGWIAPEDGTSTAILALVVNKELVATFSPDIYRDNGHFFSGGPTGFELELPNEINDGRLLEVELYLLTDRDSQMIGRVLYSSGRKKSKRVSGAGLRGDVVRITQKEVAIVSTHSRNSRRLVATARVLSALKRAGLQVIVVDTSPEDVPVSRLSELAPGVSVVRRDNEGWDFGSWFEVIRSLGILDVPVERLLLTNDSYFVTSDFDRTVRAILQGSTDIIGVTESLAHTRHLQSYLLSFKVNEATIRLFERLITNVGIQADRSGVIQSAELGLMGMAEVEGVSSSALFTYERLASLFVRDFEQLLEEERRFGAECGPHNHGSAIDRCMSYLARGVRLNPTHFFWRQLLESGAGVIKRELIEKNPNQISLAGLMGTLHSGDRERLAVDLAAHDMYLPNVPLHGAT